jgi:hypothetical protein
MACGTFQRHKREIHAKGDHGCDGRMDIHRGEYDIKYQHQDQKRGNSAQNGYVHIRDTAQYPVGGHSQHADERTQQCANDGGEKRDNKSDF